MIDVFCDEIYECIVYERLIGSLDNKDSILYRTLLLAIRRIEEGGKQYIVSRRVSIKYLFLKVLENIGTKKIKYKLPKNKPLSLILNCYNDTCSLLY